MNHALEMTILIATFLFVATPPPKSSSPQLPAMQTVRFEAADGVVIEADYYPPAVKDGEKAPVAICIHMYPADRKSWEALAPSLREGDARFAVLAYDIRGHGGSTEPKGKDLAAKYERRDPAHFADAWKDVEAAKKWLAVRKECDTGRIALIGASIGCSISLDYGRRDNDVKAVVCLSPGVKYMGVDSVSHIKRCGHAKVLLVSPEAEYSAVRELVEASGDRAKGVKFPGGRERHGTGMLDPAYSESAAVRKEILKHLRPALEQTLAPWSEITLEG